MTFVLEVFMNIIIVGCGKVGYTLVEQLGGENHNITGCHGHRGQWCQLSDTV